MDCRSGHISERSYRPATDEPNEKRLKHQRSFSAHGHGYTGIRRGSYLGHPYQPDPLLRTRCVHRNGHSLIILISTWKLLKESLYLTLDAVPEHIHLDKLEQEISQTQGVESWHHLHVWAVSTTENAATLHVVITSLNEIECTKHALKQLLSQHGITHSTIEFETPGSQCEDTAKGCYHS